MISIIIPLYNEEQAVENVILDIITSMNTTSYQYEIIVVDDGSTDNSKNKVRKIPGVKVLSHENNKGAGAARTTGIIASCGEIIVIIDADGTYPAKMIPRLIEQMDKYDMVIGQRNREVIRPRYLRWGIKVILNKIVSVVTNTGIKDINSGMRVFKKKLVLPFLDFMPNGHSWVSTITIIFAGKGYPTGYFPIDYYPRIGKSSFNLLFDGLRSLNCIIKAIRFIKSKNMSYE